MKELWDKLNESVLEFGTNIDKFGEGMTTPRLLKAYNKLLDSWNKVVVKHLNYSKAVEPLQPKEIKLPFKGEEFLETWTIYKEYLIENFQRHLGNRQEAVVLKYLKKYSKNNVSKAIAILEFHILHNYKGLFPISDKQLTGEEPIKDDESLVHSDIIQKPKKKL